MSSRDSSQKRTTKSKVRSASEKRASSLKRPNNEAKAVKTLTLDADEIDLTKSMNISSPKSQHSDKHTPRHDPMRSRPTVIGDLPNPANFVEGNVTSPVLAAADTSKVTLELYGRHIDTDEARNRRKDANTTYTSVPARESDGALVDARRPQHDAKKDN